MRPRMLFTAAALALAAVTPFSQLAAAQLSQPGSPPSQPVSSQGPQSAIRSPQPVLDSAELDRLTREVSTELRCPVCQGESIQESPAELSQEMRAIVREQLAAGKSPDEVKAYFVGRYGEWILLRPTTSGVNALLYWLPPVLLVAGIVLVIVIARRWTRAGATSDSSPATPDHVS